MTRKMLPLILLTSTFSLCLLNSVSKSVPIAVPARNLFCPHTIASDACLVYDSEQEKFTAILDGHEKQIDPWDISGAPSDLSEIEMQKFVEAAHFSLTHIGDDCGLKIGFPLNGGMKKGIKDPETVARENFEKLQQMTSEYERLSTLVSKHTGSCTVVTTDRRQLFGEEADVAYAEALHKRIPCNVSNRYCGGGHGHCQLAKHTARLRELERLMDLCRRNIEAAKNVART